PRDAVPRAPGRHHARAVAAARRPGRRRRGEGRRLPDLRRNGGGRVLLVPRQRQGRRHALGRRPAAVPDLRRQRRPRPRLRQRRRRAETLTGSPRQRMGKLLHLLILLFLLVILVGYFTGMDYIGAAFFDGEADPEKRVKYFSPGTTSSPSAKPARKS